MNLPASFGSRYFASQIGKWIAPVVVQLVLGIPIVLIAVVPQPPILGCEEPDLCTDLSCQKRLKEGPFGDLEILS